LQFQQPAQCEQMHIIKILFFAIICCVTNFSCIHASLDKIESDPDFNWDSLKRDEILMTPLIDLRDQPSVPRGAESLVAPFSTEEKLAYAEVFKQKFFILRKDIRVFGAGGAFESLASIKKLDDLAGRVVANQNLTRQEIDLLRSTTQDIRFIFFFDFSMERLQYDYQMSDLNDRPYVEKIYSSERMMEIKMALWDSQNAKTVWIGHKILNPANTNIVKIKKRHLSKIMQDILATEQSIVLEPDEFDRQGLSSREEELSHHRTRFPSFPAREPAFSDSFEDFVLSLPIQPSEEKLIAYSHFTYHRPEMRMLLSHIDSSMDLGIFGGFSSILYNRFRLGGELSNQFRQYRSSKMVNPIRLVTPCYAR
jgi:hypothetical protein